MVKKVRSKQDIETMYLGDEPSFDKDSDFSLITALNWYSYAGTPKESKKYTLQYLKDRKYDKDVLERVSSLDEERFQNIGFVCRIISRGGVLGRAERKSFQDKLELLTEDDGNAVDVVETEEVIEQKNKNDIQKRIADKTSEFCGEVLNIIDICVASNDWDFNLYVWLLGAGVKTVHTKKIISILQKELDEMLRVQEGKDKILVEAYSNFSKTRMKSYIKMLGNFIEDCRRIVPTKKTISKPKAVNLDKVVSKLSFKKEDIEYKLKSIQPKSVLGASELWVFNTKTRKLGRYIAKDADGLGIKGSKITNYNEETSTQKILRKPDEILGRLHKGGKLVMRKLMNEITSTEYPLTGSINGDTMLLKTN